MKDEYFTLSLHSSQHLVQALPTSCVHVTVMWIHNVKNIVHVMNKNHMCFDEMYLCYNRSVVCVDVFYSACTFMNVSEHM